MTICLFPDLKIITTFAILKMDEKISNSKAWLKQKDKIGARISHLIRKNKEAILSYSDTLLIFNELIGALSCRAIPFFFFFRKKNCHLKTIRIKFRTFYNHLKKLNCKNVKIS